MSALKESHLIIPPVDEELKKRLALKLEEYEIRIAGKGKPWEYWHPAKAHLLCEDYRDACYKAYILDAVLKSDVPVDIEPLLVELQGKWKDSFNLQNFCEACAVVDKYCGNLPDTPFLNEGTGLPELPEDKDSGKE